MTGTDSQIRRYSRQLILDEVGQKGQEKLSRARILVIGAGGLGAPALLYLAAAGVGTLGIADSENVDVSNLHRQIVHFTSDVGKEKTQSAKEKLKKLNPNVTVITHPQRVRQETARGLIDGYDVVIDGTDNFETKFMINDVCIDSSTPFVHAGIVKFEGQVTTVVPHAGPCIRCLFDAPPPVGAVPSCGQAGILGAVAGVIGSIQAAEALKLILGAGDVLSGRLLVADILRMTFRTVEFPRRRGCGGCGRTAP